MKVRLLRWILWLGVCLPLPASAQSPRSLPPEVLALAADFEGRLERSVSTAYLCKGKVDFSAAPTLADPDNKALLLTLDPKRRAASARCETPGDPTERAELAEPDSARLPLGIETWYSFRLFVPPEMKGKFAGHRLVVAQIKQHQSTCALLGATMTLLPATDGNPIVSLRMIEDEIGDVMGLQLAVSSDHVRKISIGQLMRHRDAFLGRWHDVLLHAKIVPHSECACGRPQPKEAGYVEAWLDGQPFAGGRYGTVDDGTGAVDYGEPFGYTALGGCTYFKYGLYRDLQAEPWTIGFDRFRRGASRAEVEMPAPQ